MSLFERLSRVARAEANYAKSQHELLYRTRMEARLQELDNLVGNNDLSKLIRLIEEINADIAAMKVQLSGSVISR
jgi:hypothetical protein